MLLEDYFTFQRQYPHIDVLRVGDKSTPPLETLALIFEASEAEEWINEMQWIPF
jgi:hypothetical protein